MCTDPQIFNGVETSCRKCDSCAATYKNTWVARCCAEVKANPYAFVFTLTYADIDGVPPLGASVYRYKDVQDMWKRIRSAGARKWKKKDGHDFRLRYVVVGEKGTKFGRCHYHGVVFSNYPIAELGKITSKFGKEGIVYKTRQHWSLWGHGFVEFQPATRKGFAYALKYILKGRMSSEKSKGQGREGKTEWLASSYLWCSKIPSIGETWLWPKLYQGLKRQMVPPSLRIPVPNGGEWYVRGEAQRRMCLWIREKNIEFKEQTGRDLAGYKSIVASLDHETVNTETGEVTKPKAYGWLTDGEEEEYTTEERQKADAFIARQCEQFDADYFKKQSRRFQRDHNQQIVKKCGNIRPCNECWDHLPRRQKDNIKTQWYIVQADYKGGSRREFEKHWLLSECAPSTGCRRRFDKAVVQSFEQYKRLIRSPKQSV